MYNQRNATFWVGTLIVVLAGAWTIFHLIWNIAGNQTDDYWGIALLILFILALILSFICLGCLAYSWLSRGEYADGSALIAGYCLH